MRWILPTLVAVHAAGPLHGQGFSIHSHSACALARNSTGVADPCADGSAAFYNPAALAFQGSVASLGIEPLYSKGTFTFDRTGASFDSQHGTKFAPHAWVAAQVTSRISAGIGLWGPYGLTTLWPLAFEGRYIGYDNSLRAIYIQPTIAGELIPERLALGVGVAAVRGSARLRQRIDLARTTIPTTNLTFSVIGVPDGTDFADASLDADDWSATFHVGAQFRPSDRWALGARYLHSVTLDLQGTAGFRQIETGFLLPPGNPFGLPPGTPIDLLLATQFQPGAPLGDQRLTTEITLPNQFVAGVRFQATTATRVFFDYQWTGWHHFDEAVLHLSSAPTDTLLFEFRNASTWRLAAEYAARELTIRAGLLQNTAAAPAVTVIPLLPEARRTSFAGGLGYRITERFGVDAGLEVLLQRERAGRVRPRTSREQTAAELNVGRYSAHGVFGSFTLSYVFGATRAPTSDEQPERRRP